MNNVIGPFSPDDWFVLRQVREAVRWMTTKDSDRYRLQIDKEKDIYKGILNEYLKAA